MSMTTHAGPGARHKESTEHRDREVAIAAHPSAAGGPAEAGDTAADGVRPLDEEDGSLVTEYGLLAVVAATIAAAVINWAADGALSTLFNALMRQARDIVGA